MKVLRLLRSAKEKHLSGARLARSLGVSRAAVHKQIQKLRGEGYLISGTNRSGYRLLRSPQGLDAAAFPGPLGRPFHYFPVLPSTQAEAKRLAAAGAPEGTLVAAGRQTRGRGRLGRKWMSPSGGLWFSLVLRPSMPPRFVPALTLAAALSWVKLLRRLGVPAQVKWPNDVWADGGKLAGLLTEMSSETDRVHWVVLGVGMNVNNRPPSGTAYPARSLQSLLGEPASLRDLLGQWLAAFAADYKTYASDGFRSFRRPYQRWMQWRGEKVRCESSQGTVTGVLRGIDDEGRLLLRGNDGASHALQEGELRPLS